MTDTVCACRMKLERMFSVPGFVIDRLVLNNKQLGCLSLEVLDVLGSFLRRR
jgi:hypothetical protein